MLPFPETASDPVALADWLEINALLSDDKNCSGGDLESALRKSPGSDEVEPATIEARISEAFLELEQRAENAGEAYPFEVDIVSAVVQAKKKWERLPAYIFCLCLSYFGWDAKKNARIFPKVFPRRMFEMLSCAAAINYLDGTGVGFGSPREKLPEGFIDAVNELCKRMGEGEGCKIREHRVGQDDTLDIVVWKNFVSTVCRPGKLLLFGQCATGKNWPDKLSELQPDDFCEEWMIDQPVSPCVKSFFIPHRIRSTEWSRVSRKAGIIFDRCRISYWVHSKEAKRRQREGIKLEPFLVWSKKELSKRKK